MNRRVVEMDLDLSHLDRYIESEIPLVPGETGHQWQLALLAGCGVCGSHEGYECTLCRRVVDYECDQELAAAIGLILAVAVMGP